MNKPISVGDMVMVVRRKPCCGAGNLGFAFIVKKVHTTIGHCMHCGDRHESTFAVDESGEIFRMSRLQKIPPIVGDVYTSKRSTVKA